MSADDVAKAFIPHYYNLFDTNREGLVSLFRETSSLTLEGDGPKTGVAQIMEKLRGLPPARDGPESGRGATRHDLARAEDEDRVLAHGRLALDRLGLVRHLRARAAVGRTRAGYGPRAHRDRGAGAAPAAGCAASP